MRSGRAFSCPRFEARGINLTPPVVAVGLVLAASALLISPDGGSRSAQAADDAPAVSRAATAGERASRLFPPTGTPGGVALPSSAIPVDTSDPDRTIGNGTPSSCTSGAVVNAVALGGVITFDCGPNPKTIAMTSTAKVVNTSSVVVLDGGGLITLSGLGQRRILYMNTCDQAQTWTTSHCQNQAEPSLTLQGLRFVNGNSTGAHTDGGGGGAVFVRGGRLKVIESSFIGNHCESTGPDIGGGALRVLSQYQGLPVMIASSTFAGNFCSNGGATSGIGVSWQIYNSVFEHNHATGNGANPAKSGTPGGGNGGAIYLDGLQFTLDLRGSVVRDNVANEGGGAIFFVSNNRTGTIQIIKSVLQRNPSLGFETAGLPGIFYLGSGAPTITDSTLE